MNGNRTTPKINAPDEWIPQNENVLAKYKINPNQQVHSLNYDDDGISWQKYIYISCAYWVFKKHVMEKFPLNENLL